MQQFKALLSALENNVPIKSDLAEIRGDLAVAYERLGRAQKETGKIEQALDAYNRGLKVLNEPKPPMLDLPLLATKAILLTRLSEVFQEKDQWREALALLQESSSLSTQIAAGDQSSAEYKRVAIDDLRRLAAGYLQAGAPAKAPSILPQLVAQYRSFESEPGTYLAIEGSIAEAHSLLSDCFEKLGQSKDAIDKIF